MDWASACRTVVSELAKRLTLGLEWVPRNDAGYDDPFPNHNGFRAASVLDRPQCCYDHGHCRGRFCGPCRLPQRREKGKQSRSRLRRPF
jgi:hypothetical protein